MAEDQASAQRHSHRGRDGRKCLFEIFNTSHFVDIIVKIIKLIVQSFLQIFTITIVFLFNIFIKLFICLSAEINIREIRILSLHI